MSELLTGKCKEDFEKWLKKQPFVYFNKYTKSIIIQGKEYSELNERFLTALIIEFFDSVGISIFQYPIVNSKDFDSVILYSGTYININVRLSRQQATNEAIKKSNLIYNGL